MATDLNTPDGILGTEFLTWLWFRADTAPGAFQAKDGSPFAVTMDQRITVQGGEGDGLETASVSGTLSPLREARTGLSTGKKVTRALITFEKDEQTYQLSIKCDDFSLSGVKTPKIDKADADDDPDALILEKIMLLETVTDLFDCVYSTFLGLRMDAASWDAEVARMQAWMSSAE